MLILGDTIYLNDKVMSIDEYKEEMLYERIEYNKKDQEYENTIYDIEAEYALGHIDDREYHSLNHLTIDEYNKNIVD